MNVQLRAPQYGMGNGLDPAGFTDIAPLAAPSSDPGASLYSQLIAQGVQPADAYGYDPSGAIAAGVDPSTLFTITSGAVTPGAVLTPAQLAAQQTSASAWLLQNVPVSATGVSQASTLASLALTAAQIASGLTAGTVQRTTATACPSGYKYSTGPCVPSPSIIPGVSNTMLGVAVVVIIGLVMMGSKR